MSRYNYGLPKGTPVIYRNKNCIVEKEAYTARYLDATDYEMINHGMGHMAGSYGCAIDLFCVDDGLHYKKVKPKLIKKLKEDPNEKRKTR